MSTPDIPTTTTTAPVPAPARLPGYVPAHEDMCPLGPHLVCADSNAMPQRMWKTNVQRWTCEGCAQPMVREFHTTHWSAWRLDQLGGAA